MHSTATVRDTRIGDRERFGVVDHCAEIPRRELHPLAAVLKDRDPTGEHSGTRRDERLGHRDGGILEVPRVIEVRRSYFGRCGG